MLSPGLWVTAHVDFTPPVDKSALAYAELRTAGTGPHGGWRNVWSATSSTPASPAHCLVAFEVDPAALPEHAWPSTSNPNDQRGDDMAVVDLGITADQVAHVEGPDHPVELVMPKAAS